MALAGALCLTLFAVTGFPNRSLRALAAGLLGSTCSADQMGYDLRRLRLHRLVRRLERRNRYVLTTTGSPSPSSTPNSVNASCHPCSPIDQPNAPPALVRALNTISNIQGYLDDARLAIAA